MEFEPYHKTFRHRTGTWLIIAQPKVVDIDATMQFHMFYIFALFSIFIDNRSLYQAFGFHKEYPIIIGFILFSDALAPMDTLVKFLMNMLTRKFEFEAGMDPQTRKGGTLG